MEVQCIFCGNQMEVSEIPTKEMYDCFCPNCNNYKITREAFNDLPHDLQRKYKDQKHLISGYLFEMNDAGLSPEVITTSNVEYFFNNSKVPHNITGKLDKLLLHLFRRMNFFHQFVKTKLDIPAIGYAKNSEELRNMFHALKELNYINASPISDSHEIDVLITLEGINKVEILQNKGIDSTQVFVALWFDDEIKNVFHNYIAEAIKETGYDPLIIDMVEHNEDICDNIIAEIRKSKFLIADFTGDRGGVYFEAGFAYGLGMPVVWTCKKDWFEKVHFDVEHYNFIIWENGEELKEKLKNRIMATIPKG